MSGIRRARISDLGDVFDLTRKFATTFRPEFVPFKESFHYLITQDDASLLVCEESAQVVGYLLGFDHHVLFANGRISFVEEIMVREDLHRRGHGAALMTHFEQWARSRGSKMVALVTRRAAGFYLRLGYEESATYFRKLL